MRIAALYDIHGNLPALEAVLEDVARAGVDRIVIGGDVLPGPMVRDSLAALAACGVPVDAIFGNGEVATLEIRAGRVPSRVPEAHRPAMAWSAAELTAADEAWVRAWPATRTLRVDGIGDVLFCHATPRDENEIFTGRTSEERVAPAFAGVDAALVVCGHTHMQFDRTVAGRRIVNAGSVGMPFSGPGACWLLVGDGVEFRRTGYALDAAAARIRATGYPEAEMFVEKYVLSAPTEAEMLDLFSKYEMR